jgi:hypothetical protein
MQWNVIGRFFVIGAELADVEGLEIVCRNKIFSLLDGLA